MKNPQNHDRCFPRSPHIIALVTWLKAAASCITFRRSADTRAATCWAKVGGGLQCSAARRDNEGQLRDGVCEGHYVAEGQGRWRRMEEGKKGFSTCRRRWRGTGG